MSRFGSFAIPKLAYLEQGLALFDSCVCASAKMRMMK